MRRISQIAFLALVSLAFTSCSSKSLNGVKILYTNDVHSSFDESDTSIGMNNVAGYRKYLENKGRYVGLVDSGDFIQGSILGILTGGDLPAKVLSEMNYDAAAIGNHEFDFTYKSCLGENGYYKKYNLPYTSLNLKYKNDNTNVFDTSKIVKYGDTKVAYVSVLTPTTPAAANPKNLSDDNGNLVFEFGQSLSDKEFFKLVQDEIDAVAAKSDYVVLLTHLGVLKDESKYTSYDLISNTSGADVVLDAHSHTSLQSENVKNKVGDDVLLSSTGTKLESLGELTIDTNGTKDKSDDIIETRLLNKDYIKERSNNSSNDRMKKFLEDVNQSLSSIKNEKLFKNEEALTITNENGVRISRSREVALGSLVCDSFLSSAKDADIAVTNGGGVRANLKSGDITYGDILEVLPFMNDLSLIEISGDKIKDMLEFGVKSMENECQKEVNGKWQAVGEFGGFLHVAGMKFNVNTSIPSPVVTDEKDNFLSINGNRRVSNILIYNKSSKSYEEIIDTKMYKMIITDFLYVGGNGYTMLMNEKLLLDKIVTDSQALIDYVKNDLNSKITKSYISTLTGRINII